MGGRGWRALARTPRGFLRFAQSSPGHPIHQSKSDRAPGVPVRTTFFLRRGAKLSRSESICARYNQRQPQYIPHGGGILLAAYRQFPGLHRLRTLRVPNLRYLRPSQKQLSQPFESGKQITHDPESIDTTDSQNFEMLGKPRRLASTQESHSTGPNSEVHFNP